MPHHNLNKIIWIISHNTLNKLSHNICKSEIFATMVHGIKDITRKQHESSCSQHVDGMLNIHKEFKSFCELMSNMTSTWHSKPLPDVSIQVKFLLVAVH